MDECSLEVCIICMESMNDPRILPCAHSFCLKCLESSTISSNSSTCPKCLMNFEIPQGGLKNLKKNAFIEQLSILKQNGINCDSCKKIQAVKYCVDCSLNYCTSCLEHHARIPTTNSHQLQPAKSTKAEKINNKYLHCVEHSELMSLACEKCRILICSHCLTLNHKNHNFMHISDYLDSAKVKFEEHLKVKEELRQCVFKNMKTSEDMIRDNELKASNLKKKNLERGEDIKKIIDSIVASLNQRIDNELKQNRKVADKVSTSLYEMERELSEQIETLKHQLRNLNYTNLAEVEFNTLEQFETIPNYSKDFSIPLKCEDLNEIETFIKSIERAQRANFVKEDILDSNIETITSHKEKLYSLEKLPNYSIRIKSCFENSNTNSYINSHLIEFLNMLVIEDVFFVSGVSTNGDHYILKSVHDSDSFHIYYHQPFIEKFSDYMLVMSKSIYDNIIVNYYKKLLHLFNDVTKKIILPFPIHALLQLYDESYAVCCDEEVCIIGNNGRILVRHSYDSSYSGIKHDLILPRCLTKDRRGNFYVYDSATRKVFVLDCHLRIKLSFDVKCPLRDIVYDDERNVLMVLRGDKSLLTCAW